MICGLVAVAAAYIIAMRRGTIGADDDVTPWFRHQGWRPLFFFTGLLITFIALESPIDRGGDYYLFSIHMVQHMLLMMVAPPLILLGIAGSRPSPRERHTTLRTVWWAITRPWPAVATSMVAPKCFSIFSEWSRVGSGSSTVVIPGAFSPASRIADFTWAEATGRR